MVDKNGDMIGIITIGIITTFDLMRAFQKALSQVGEALRDGI